MGEDTNSAAWMDGDEQLKEQWRGSLSWITNISSAVSIGVTLWLLEEGVRVQKKNQ